MPRPEFTRCCGIYSAPRKACGPVITGHRASGTVRAPAEITGVPARFVRRGASRCCASARRRVRIPLELRRTRERETRANARIPLLFVRRAREIKAGELHVQSVRL